MDEEQLTQLVAEAMDLPADERIDFFVNKGMSEEEIDDALQTLQQVEDFDLEQDLNIASKEPEDAAERLSSDAEDDLEQKAQKMADEDNTPVTVTEEDTDGDSDPDKVTAEKEEPESDIARFEDAADELTSEDNSSEEGDVPHDEETSEPENSTNSIAKTLANYRW